MQVSLNKSSTGQASVKFVMLQATTRPSGINSRHIAGPATIFWELAVGQVTIF